MTELLTPQILLRLSSFVPVLDFDGVIADTEPLHAAAYEKIIRSHKPSLKHFDFSKYVGHSEEDIYNMLNRDFDISMNIEKDKPTRIKEFETLVHQRALRPNQLASQIFSSATQVHILSSQDPEVISRLATNWGFWGKCRLIEYRKRFKSKFDAIPHLPSYTGSKNENILYVEDNVKAIGIANDASFTTVYVSHSLNGPAPKAARYCVAV